VSRYANALVDYSAKTAKQAFIHVGPVVSTSAAAFRSFDVFFSCHQLLDKPPVRLFICTFTDNIVIKKSDKSGYHRATESNAYREVHVDLGYWPST